MRPHCSLTDSLKHLQPGRHDSMTPGCCRHGWHADNSQYRLWGDEVCTPASVHCCHAALACSVLIEQGANWRRLGVPEGDVLDAIASWSPEKQAEGNQILADIEGQVLPVNNPLSCAGAMDDTLASAARSWLSRLGGAGSAQLAVHAWPDRAVQLPRLARHSQACLLWLVAPRARRLLGPSCTDAEGQQACRGLITRNVRASVEHFHAKLPVPPFRPALDRSFLPYKPDPAAILHICRDWGLTSSQVVMVGDSAKDDVRASSFALLHFCFVPTGPTPRLWMPSRMRERRDKWCLQAWGNAGSCIVQLWLIVSSAGP